jgi:hypothetical protein
LFDSTTSTTDHEAMTTYLALHLAFSSQQKENLPQGAGLGHRVYVDSLPKSNDLRTPCYFSEGELLLLSGTNLVGATKDRLEGWKLEWEGVKRKLRGFEVERLTW